MNNLDDRINKEIKEALDKEMSESAMDINVNTRDGFVTLSGIVDTLAEKRAAEEIATMVKGINGIENTITISTDGTITDRQIQMEVVNKLHNSEFSEKVAGVNCSVSDGVVVLKGAVDTLRGEKLAINEAEKAIGAKDIVSNIRIASSGRFDDASIQSKLTREFAGTRLSIPDIFTEVHGGTVRLSGYVNNRQEMELAVEIAQDIEGVKDVSNKLRLRQAD